jgi:hypothetical protein
MTQNYPDISIQSAISPSPWWLHESSRDVRRGRLIWAFLPHVDQVPYKLTPIGRVSATEHQQATVRIEPLRIKQPQPYITLPVAGMPSYPGEVRIVQRAKRRPALVLGLGGLSLPKQMTLRRPVWQVSHTILVAPYYGGMQDGSRAGFPSEFLERVRRCEFPQFMSDLLPIGAGESILYLNHIQPLGHHHDSIEPTDFCLSEDAINIMDEWVIWVITGLLPKNGIVLPARKQFLEFD